MLVHAKVAKLQKHLGDPSFDRVLAEIEAANNEGLEYFELEVHRLSDDARLDLLAALEALEYTVTTDSGYLFQVNVE